MTLLAALVTDDVSDATVLNGIGCLNNNITAMVASVPKHFSGYSVNHNAGTRYYTLGFESDQSGNTIYGSFYLNLQAYPSAIDAIFVLGSSYDYQSVPQIALCVDNTGKLVCRRVSTSIGTGTKTLELGTWYQINFEVFVHNTTGFMKVRINGDSSYDLNVTNSDTQQQSTDSVYIIEFGSVFSSWPTTATMYTYRPIICNSAGTKNNGALPWDIKHAILYPNADGATEWSKSTGADAYALIDDSQNINSASDTDYVYSSTLNEKNIVGLENVSIGSGTVLGVIVASRFDRATTGTVGVKVGTKVSATENQSNQFYLPASAYNHRAVFEYSTGTTEFTGSDITDLELTAEVTAVG